MELRKPRVDIIRLDAVCAEVHFSWQAFDLPPGAELRGRFVGPRCALSHTIEIAYPLRPVPGRLGVFSCIVPEPSLWEPASPFLYEAIMEVWHEGTCIATQATPVGLRIGHA